MMKRGLKLILILFVLSLFMFINTNKVEGHYELSDYKLTLVDNYSDLSNKNYVTFDSDTDYETEIASLLNNGSYGNCFIVIGNATGLNDYYAYRCIDGYLGVTNNNKQRIESADYTYLASQNYSFYAFEKNTITITDQPSYENDYRVGATDSKSGTLSYKWYSLTNGMALNDESFSAMDGGVINTYEYSNYVESIIIDSDSKGINLLVGATDYVGRIFSFDYAGSETITPSCPYAKIGSTYYVKIDSTNFSIGRTQNTDSKVTLGNLSFRTPSEISNETSEKFGDSNKKGVYYCTITSTTGSTKDTNLVSFYSNKHSHNDITYSVLPTFGALDGYYYVMDDMVATGSYTIASGKTVHICLNGSLLDLNGYNIVNNGGSLYIEDCSTDGSYRSYSIGSNGIFIRDVLGEYSSWGGIIYNGYSSTDGGAICSYDGSLSIERVSIIGSTAENNGGAIYFYSSDSTCNLTIDSSTYINGNYAKEYGGAIYIDGPKSNTSSVNTIKSSYIEHNNANNGGAIAKADYSILTIDEVYLCFNKALEYGAAIYVKDCLTSYGVTLKGSFISENKAKHAAIYDNNGEILSGTINVSQNTNYKNEKIGYLFNDSSKMFSLSSFSEYSTIDIETVDGPYLQESYSICPYDYQYFSCFSYDKGILNTQYNSTTSSTEIIATSAFYWYPTNYSPYVSINGSYFNGVQYSWRKLTEKSSDSYIISTNNEFKNGSYLQEYICPNQYGNKDLIVSLNITDIKKYDCLYFEASQITKFICDCDYILYRDTDQKIFTVVFLNDYSDVDVTMRYYEFGEEGFTGAFPPAETDAAYKISNLKLYSSSVISGATSSSYKPSETETFLCLVTMTKQDANYNSYSFTETTGAVTINYYTIKYAYYNENSELVYIDEYEESIIEQSPYSVPDSNVAPAQKGFGFHGWKLDPSYASIEYSIYPVEQDYVFYADFYEKSDPTITNIEITINSKDYNNEEIEFDEVTCDFDPVYGKQDYTVYFKLKDADDSTYSSTKPKNAGTYVYKVVFLENDNLKEYEYTPEDNEFTINRINNSITNLKQDNILCNETVNPSCDTIDGTPIYLFSDKADGTYTSDIPSTAGTWYLKAKVNTTTNYNEVTSDYIMFTISHEYEVKFVWEGYTKATATFTCKNHKDEVITYSDLTPVYQLVTPATCDKPGEYKYTVEVTFNGVVVTDSKTGIIDKLGHDYKVDRFEWDGYVATAHVVCMTDNNHYYDEACVMTSVITTSATCTTDGVRTYTATYTIDKTEYTDTKTEVIPALNHDYRFSEIVWDQENHTAKAIYICSHDNSHKEEHECVITSEVTLNPTCTEKGTRKYTATYNDVSDYITEDIPMLNHDYEFSEIVWDEYTAKAIYVCSHDNSHKEEHECVITNEITTPATCTTDGVRTYTATYDGHTSTTTQSIPKLNHNYEFDKITWDEFTAKAYYICKNDSEHVVSYDCTITSEITLNPTCTTNGVRTYTATYDGNTSKANETIPMLNHDYQFSEIVWDNENYTAKAIYVCSHNDSHKEEHECTVTSEITIDATCTTNGERTYTATYEENKSTKTVVIDSLGHDYRFKVITWTGFEAVAIYECNHNGLHQEEHACTITVEVTDATCEADGLKVYTATYDGYTDTKEEVINKLGHSYTIEEVKWNSDGTECTITHYCEHDHSHFISEVKKIEAPVINEEDRKDGQVYVDNLKVVDGKITEDVYLSVSETSEEEKEEITLDLSNEIKSVEEVACIIDIQLLNSSNEVITTESNNKYSVTISISDDLKGRDNYSIIIINKNGTTEVVEAVLNEAKDSLTFVTKEFNKIAVVATKDSKASNAFSLASLTIFVMFTICFTLKFNPKSKESLKNTKKLSALAMALYLIMINVSLVFIVNTSGFIIFGLNVVTMLLGGLMLVTKLNRIK